MPAFVDFSLKILLLGSIAWEEKKYKQILYLLPSYFFFERGF